MFHDTLSQVRANALCRKCTCNEGGTIADNAVASTQLAYVYSYILPEDFFADSYIGSAWVPEKFVNALHSYERHQFKKCI